MKKELLELIKIEAVVNSKEAFEVVKKRIGLKDEDFNVFRYGYVTGALSTAKSVLDDLDDLGN